MPVDLRDCPSGRYPSQNSCTPLRFPGSFISPCNSKSTPPCCHHRLSSTASHVPTASLEHPGLIPSTSPSPGQMCVDRRKRRVLCLATFDTFLFLVLRVFSSALSPGFIGPASSVLSVDLPPSAPSPASGSPYRFGFIAPLAAFSARSGGLPWVRRTTSPYPVRLHLGSVLRISGLALPRLLDLLPAAI
jgi:hypothetical protein